MSHAVFTNAMEQKAYDDYYGDDATCSCGTNLICVTDKEYNQCPNPQCREFDCSDYSSGGREWINKIDDFSELKFICSSCKKEFSTENKYDFETKWDEKDEVICYECEEI